MMQVSTFVFFDIETTGLPYQEKNRTKITELCLLAVSRRDIEIYDNIVPVNKLTLILNPGRKIHPDVETLTGITNEYLKNAPTFAQKFNHILHFIKELPKPVCLVAHNGNIFDYKILLAECNDVNLTLPDDLLCVDTLVGFRKLINGYVSIKKPSESTSSGDDILTADEDVWPLLNVTPEDWQEIDDLCTSIRDISCGNEDDISDESMVKQEHKQHNDNKNDKYFKQESIDKKEIQDVKEKRSAMIQNIFGDSNNSCQLFPISKDRKIKKNKNIAKSKTKTTANSSKRNKGEFTLSGLYKKILNKDLTNAHRAEGDCLALLECVAAMKESFLPWMDGACKRLTEITPLSRY